MTTQIIAIIIGLLIAMATVAFWIHKSARLRGGDGKGTGEHR